MVVNEINYAIQNLGILNGAFQIENGWKYVRRPGNPLLPGEELFNVFEDPSESNGLKNDYPEIFEAMRIQFDVRILSF